MSGLDPKARFDVSDTRSNIDGSGRKDKRYMNWIACAAIAAIVSAAAAHAEDDAAATTGILIGGARQSPKAKQRCVEVEIGGDRAFGCLNHMLKQQVDRVSPVLNSPPTDAKSSDLKVGTVNIPAIHQQYGRNFGVSGVPYRAPLIYNSPLRPRR
jgi:hypothetical protein